MSLVCYGELLQMSAPRYTRLNDPPPGYSGNTPSSRQSSSKWPRLGLWPRFAKCDRRGHYRVSTLVERYGADFAGLDLRQKLSVDCPSMPLSNFTGAIFPSPTCSG